MKRISFSLLASAILLFSACTNEGSSTVATHEDDETTTSTEQGHEATKGEHNETTTVQKDTGSAASDTIHTMGAASDTAAKHK